MTDTIEARVARGAALLDEAVPGWETMIDLGALDLESSCRCVVGQIGNRLMAEGIMPQAGVSWSDYEEEYRRGENDPRFPNLSFWPTWAWLKAQVSGVWAFATAGDYGFMEVYGISYTDLDEAWIALIKERFNTGNLSG